MTQPVNPNLHPIWQSLARNQFIPATSARQSMPSSGNSNVLMQAVLALIASRQPLNHQESHQ